MKRNTLIAVLIGAFVLVVFLLLSVFNRQNNAYDWKENYKAESKTPYGNHIIYSLLEGYFPDYTVHEIKDKFVNDLPLDSDNFSNYVFVGEAMYLDSADVQQLLKFVSDGNNAFISSKSLPYDLMFYLYFDECDDAPWDDIKVVLDTAIQVGFLQQNLQSERAFTYNFIQEHQTKSYKWGYLDSMYFCDIASGFSPLGQIIPFGRYKGKKEYYNFAKLQYRDPSMPDSKGGTFYFHTNPILFTNYHMLEQKGKAYAENVFSHLEEGDIYWDSYSKVSEIFSRKMNRRRQRLSLPSESPLKYILGNKYLSGAWFTLVFMGIVFLMFRSKRKQRIIPVLQPNANTSLEYVATIGDVHFKYGSHNSICDKQMKNFLLFVRTKLNISTNQLDEKFVTALATKTGVASNKIEDILQLYKNICNATGVISDDTLLDFHRRLEHIYAKCR